MRVLAILKTSGIGGCERHLLSVTPPLVKHGVEQHFCVLGVGAYERFAEPLRKQQIDVHVIPAGPRMNPRVPLQLIKLIRRLRPDLVHTHLVHGDVYGQLAARIARVPGVSSVHGTHEFYRRQPYRSATQMAGHMARRTIAISEHVRRFLTQERIVPAERLRVVHYGINTGEWSASQALREAERHRLGFQNHEVVVGVGSRLIPHKGHRELIDAFAIAIEQHPQLRLLVAGDGPLRKELEEYARERLPYNSFAFVGFLEDMRPFMHACDIVVFPTQPGWGEGFGLAALEAMATGRPLIATGIDSLPEVVDDKRTGFLVRPGQTQEMAQRIIDLATSGELRLRLGRQARDRAIEKFGLDRSAEGVLQVYEEIL